MYLPDSDFFFFKFLKFYYGLAPGAAPQRFPIFDFVNILIKIINLETISIDINNKIYFY